MYYAADQGHDYVGNFTDQVVNWAPKLLGAIVILVLGYLVAKILASVVRRALQKAGLDNRLHSGHGGNVIQRAVPSPTRLFTKLTFWVVFLGAVTLGLGSLGIPLITDLIHGIY